MSTLVDVLQCARDGATTAQIAARLGLAPDLADVMVDHLRRLGVVDLARAGCLDGPEAGPACAACPLAGPSGTCH